MGFKLIHHRIIVSERPGRVAAGRRRARQRRRTFPMRTEKGQTAVAQSAAILPVAHTSRVVGRSFQRKTSSSKWLRGSEDRRTAAALTNDIFATSRRTLVSSPSLFLCAVLVQPLSISSAYVSPIRGCFSSGLALSSSWMNRAARHLSRITTPPAIIIQLRHSASS